MNTGSRVGGIPVFRKDASSLGAIIERSFAQEFGFKMDTERSDDPFAQLRSFDITKMLEGFLRASERALKNHTALCAENYRMTRRLGAIKRARSRPA